MRIINEQSGAYSRQKNESGSKRVKHQHLGVTMKTYTYSQARQQLSDVLNMAEHEEVIIRRKDGRIFSVIPKRMKISSFDVPGIKTKATTEDILNAISESREF